MKLRIRKKSKKPAKILDPECFNCGHPFSGHEKFCPECGQANKDKRITFKNFIHEVFNGFISWDSKFWTTFIPLLIKPGKVSRDYIDGKRMRYANPFRFYLTISVLFFLIVGATEAFDQFKQLTEGQTKVNPSINDQISNVKKVIDSTKFETNLNNTLKKIDSTDRKEILKALPNLKLDSLNTKKRSKNQIRFGELGKYKKYSDFQKKNPNIAIDIALDSLKEEKTFKNRFIYTRIKTLNEINDSDENFKKFTKQIISYISISLFVLLPLFTLFLKFYYIRGKFTYVEHLVFVFHTQTVFFLLMTLFFLLHYFSSQEYTIPIFLLIFLIYLYLAMKKFYNQGHFKTFVKYIMINITFTIIAVFGIFVVAALAFMLY